MSDNDKVISDEAVEAAAKAAYTLRPATYYLDDSVVSWDQLGESSSGQRRKDRQLTEARVALEAAAPYMLAGAWEDGATDGHLYGIKAKNPYRSQA